MSFFSLKVNILEVAVKNILILQQKHSIFSIHLPTLKFILWLDY